MLLAQHIKPPQTTQSCFTGTPAASTENQVCMREHPPSTPFWTQCESSWEFTKGVRLRTQLTNPLELESISKFTQNLIICYSTCVCCIAWFGQSPHHSRYRAAPPCQGAGRHPHAQVRGQQLSVSPVTPVTPTPHRGMGITRTPHTTAF